jgi:hypothetical protein
MKQIVEIIADVPEGWKAIAYRIPKVGEFFLTLDGNDTVTVEPCQFWTSTPWLIVEKTTRPATQEDIGSQVTRPKGSLYRTGIAGCLTSPSTGILRAVVGKYYGVEVEVAGFSGPVLSIWAEAVVTKKGNDLDSIGI